MNSQKNIKWLVLFPLTHFILYLFFFNSCTIEKRRYTKGLNIDWHSYKKPAQKENSATLDSVAPCPNIFPIQPLKKSVNVEHRNQSWALAKKHTHTATHKSHIYNSVAIPLATDSIERKDWPTAADAMAPTKKTMNEWALAGFAFAMLYIILLTLTVTLLIEISGPASFILVALVLPLLAIIFSSIALNQIKQNPSKYDGKSLAKAGQLIGILGISLLFLLIFYLLIFPISFE